MGLLKKKADPITDRSKALSAQIAALEAQIKALDHQLQDKTTPADAVPQNGTRNGASTQGGRPAAALREPVFEPVDLRRLEPMTDQEENLAHFNDLGVRKYDLAAIWRRWRQHLRGPPASNPKLVTYLAAGSIKGLRPLRYEKRVARSRFIALFLVLVFLLWGIIAVLVRSH